MEEQKQRRYKKRRMRKGRVFITALLFLLVAVGVYVYSQFQSGVKLAGDAKPAGEVEDFVPDEKDGETVNYLVLGVDSRGE